MRLYVCFSLVFLTSLENVFTQQPGIADILATLQTNNAPIGGLPQTDQQQPGLANILALLGNGIGLPQNTQQQSSGLANLVTLLGSNVGAQSGQQQLGLANLLTFLGNPGNGSGVLQTVLERPELTSLLTTLLSNNEASLALLQTPEIVANFAELFNYLNTTGNITGVINALSTDPQVSALSSTLLTVIFESLSLTVFENTGVSDVCQKDLIIFVEELVKGSPWALRMLDATGKPPANLANLHTYFIGSYEECVAIEAVSYTQDVNGNARQRGAFDGKYCSLTFNIDGLPASVEEVLNVGIGLCLPSSCMNTDVEIMAAALERAVFNQTVPLIPTSSCKEKKEFGTDFIVAVGILSVIGCLILIGTIYDVVTTQTKPQITTSSANQENGQTKPSKVDTEDQSKPVRSNKGCIESILLAFSMYSNGQKILNTSQSGPFTALHGIRVLTLMWIILGHVYLYIGQQGQNFLNFTLNVKEWHRLPIENADNSVDTFFVISGFLVSYLTLTQLKKVGGPRNMNWFIFYLHRYLRITPAYMLILMVGTVVLPYMFIGPLWNQEDFPQMGGCRQDWWAHLLYINNFVLQDTRATRCMDWTWYLANDMQFYVVSPILVAAFFYITAAGTVVCVLILVGVTVASGWIAYTYKYPTQLIPAVVYGEIPVDEDFFRKIYAPAYTRMGTYVIGVMTGYILYRLKCKCRIPKLVNITCWFVSTGVMVVLIYCRHAPTESDMFSRLGSAVFQAVQRPVWGAAVCWIIFACTTGNGGWINELLSWKVFVPLGRLGLVNYLIHPFVIYSFTSSRMVLTYYTIYEMIYLYLFVLTFSYGLAFIISMAFEAPVMGLEKLLLAKRRKT